MKHIRAVLQQLMIFLLTAQFSFAETVRYVLTGNENIRRMQQEGASPILQMVAMLPKGTVIEIDMNELKKQKEAVRKKDPSANFDYLDSRGRKVRSANGWVKGVKVVSVPDAFKGQVDPEVVNKHELFFSINSIETLTKVFKAEPAKPGTEVRKTEGPVPGFQPAPAVVKPSTNVPKVTPVAKTEPTPKKTTLPPVVPGVTNEDAIQKLSEINAKTALMNPYSTKGCVVKVNDEFGHRTHPIFKHKHLHSGIDLVAYKVNAKGQRTQEAVYNGTILSAADGVVREAGYDQWNGNYIVVEHTGLGLKTKYAHLSKHSVKTGSTVARGQPIGISGMTGSTTGPHLHFEVHVASKVANGKVVEWRPTNPRNFMNI